MRGTWGTPILVQIDDERTDLVLGVPYEVWGLNPATGKLRWYSTAMETDSFCSSVVADGEIIYAVEGRSGGSIALRAGGRGDVTDSHVLWTGRDRNRIGTPVVQNGLIYFVSGTTANCIDADTGERVYQARLAGGRSARTERGFRGRVPGGQGYSSPVIADGKLIYVGRTGEMSVVKLGREFELLATNRVSSNDEEEFTASPAISDGALYIRSSEALYCIGTPTSR